ncbi:hypothetical protein Patl1_30381 [Pistacia atlantica]|uniref:Uncharacterized protein n=1 Tax=Pistacia atlantica TaxID=434234 RepID=A0ACC1AAC2_9ROSI|nr:hypothetical protein Patl1_30381 [Pistacia atlantica]
MGFRSVLTLLFFALALSISFQLSTCHEALKGKVSCSDCNGNNDLTGFKVMVKCDKVKKVAVATTEVSGSFQVELPWDTKKTPKPLNCLAKLLGGPVQLYVSKKNMVSNVAKGKNAKSFRISTPLAFSVSCPATLMKDGKCNAATKFGSSKTVDLPLPREWGLAPSSYYVPFFPIIGVP